MATPQPLQVLLPVANGGEDIEVVTIIDVLRRGGVEVTVASITDALHIKLSQQTNILADCFLKDCVTKKFDCIALAGGLPGAEHLRDCEPLIAMLKAQVEEKRFVAAICASPALVLAHHGLLKDTKATCYPALVEKLKTDGAIVSDDPVVVAGKIVTSRGPGTALVFGLTILQLLGKDAKATAAELVAYPQHF